MNDNHYSWHVAFWWLTKSRIPAYTACLIVFTTTTKQFWLRCNLQFSCIAARLNKDENSNSIVVVFSETNLTVSSKRFSILMAD